MQNNAFMLRSSTLKNAALSLLIAGGAIFGVSAFTTNAAAHETTISFDGFSIDDDEDLLQQLIKMDADDIEELREEMAEARADIAEAINDINDARQEAKETPGGGAIVKVAFSFASRTVTKATDKAFREVEEALDQAESDLAEMKTTLDPAEVAETQLAIDVIREELVAIKTSITELTDALSA